MIVIMKQDNILDVFTSLAANSGDSTYNPYNALLLEIYYLLLRGVKPQELTLDPKKVRVPSSQIRLVTHLV